MKSNTTHQSASGEQSWPWMEVMAVVVISPWEGGQLPRSWDQTSALPFQQLQACAPISRSEGGDGEDGEEEGLT